MSPTIALWVLIAAPPAIEQAPAPRPVAEDVVSRYIRRVRENALPPSPYTADEERRLGELYLIARVRQLKLEHLALLEQLQASQRSPELAKRYGVMVDRIRGQLAELDVEELRIHLDGTPLPEIVFPPRP